jgi:hypothetical protein
MKLEEYVLALFYWNLFTCSSLVIKNWAPYTDPLGRIRVKMLISSVQYQIITIWPQFGGRNMSSKIGRSALHRSGRGGEGERRGGTAARTVTTCPLVVKWKLVKWKHAKGACVVLAGPGIFHISLSVLFHLVLFSSSKHSTKTNNEWPSEGDKIPSLLCVMFIHNNIFNLCVHRIWNQCRDVDTERKETSIRRSFSSEAAGAH